MAVKRTIVTIMLLFMILTAEACTFKNRSSFDEEFLTEKKTGSVELKYATQFTIDRYGKYYLITIADCDRFLIVPEGEEVLENIPSDITVLMQPLDRTYLLSTSAMDLIQTIGALPYIRLSGTKENSWYIEEAKQAMESGSLLYAGKYSTPDYELILNEGCDLAIENTMIYHNPEVKEKLEAFKIPVMVERSSYEKHPLGRLEWIKLYGVLYGKEKEATDCYENELNKILPIMEKKPTGKTVAFFSITSGGSITVRKPGDYIAKMIEISGGKYVPENIPDANDNALSTINIQMEDFYAGARDADILIYNSTIEEAPKSMDDLIKKDALFSDFKAVKENQLYCTERDFFQKSTGTGDFIEDLNKAFTDSSQEDFIFLKKLR